MPFIREAPYVQEDLDRYETDFIDDEAEEDEGEDTEDDEEEPKEKRRYDQ